jgi:hypothetical protein
MLAARLGLYLLLALAIPVQIDCVERTAGTAPVAEMDRHGQQGAKAPASPSCCGDTCPDMTACAVAHAVSANSAVSLAVPLPPAPDSHYLLPSISTRLSVPFRPPANLPA